MGKLPFVIAIPLIAIAIAVGVAVVMRSAPRAKEVIPSFVMPASFQGASGGSKPSEGFTTFVGSSASQLEAQLLTTLDSSDSADLESLNDHINSL